MKELKQLVGGKIDYGNRLMSLDLVPRDESGVPIHPKTAGVMQLYSVVSCIRTCTGIIQPFFQACITLWYYCRPCLYSLACIHVCIV